MSRACFRSARKRHVESVDVISWLYLETWAFLKQVVMEGTSSPPLALERKIRAESADLLRPHHLFRNLVTIGSRVRSTHVSGRSAMARSHVRRGQIARR